MEIRDWQGRGSVLIESVKRKWQVVSAGPLQLREDRG